MNLNDEALDHLIDAAVPELAGQPKTLTNRIWFRKIADLSYRLGVGLGSSGLAKMARPEFDPNDPEQDKWRPSPVEAITLIKELDRQRAELAREINDLYQREADLLCENAYLAEANKAYDDETTIKELRKGNQYVVTKYLKAFEACQQAGDKITVLEAEVKRLRGVSGDHFAAWQKAAAERDAKRKECEENRNNWIAATKTATGLRTERDALREEVVRVEQWGKDQIARQIEEHRKANLLRDEVIASAEADVERAEVELKVALAAMREVVRISDRTHVAWIKAHDILNFHDNRQVCTCDYGDDRTMNHHADHCDFAPERDWEKINDVLSGTL